MLIWRHSCGGTRRARLEGEPDLNAALRLPGALQTENRGEEDTGGAAASVLEQVPVAAGAVEGDARPRRRSAGDDICVETLDRLAEASSGDSGVAARDRAALPGAADAAATAAVGPEFNQQRVLEEVAVLVERSDISEELARMATHIEHFRELLRAGGEVGKKLDFLLQEMNREANTLLSKTGGVGGKGTRITELGLAMKAEIEKAREQIQNVE